MNPIPKKKINTKSQDTRISTKSHLDQLTQPYQLTVSLILNNRYDSTMLMMLITSPMNRKKAATVKK